MCGVDHMKQPHTHTLTHSLTAGAAIDMTPSEPQQHIPGALAPPLPLTYPHNGHATRQPERGIEGQSTTTWGEGGRAEGTARGGDIGRKKDRQVHQSGDTRSAPDAPRPCPASIEPSHLALRAGGEVVCRYRALPSRARSGPCHPPCAAQTSVPRLYGRV